MAPIWGPWNGVPVLCCSTQLQHIAWAWIQSSTTLPSAVVRGRHNGSMLLGRFWRTSDFGAERALNIFERFHLFLFRMNTNNKFNLRLLRCFSTSSNVDRHNTILESTMCSILFPCAEKSVTQALHAFQQLENSTASDAPESWERWEIIGEGAPIGWKTRENSQKKTQVSSWYKIVVSDKNWLYFSGDNTWRCS